MSGKPDFRDYINPTASHSKDWQLSVLIGGTPYVEDKTGKIFDKLVRSIRKGTVVRVAVAYLLAPNKGGAKKKRQGWTERYKRLTKAGATLIVPGMTEAGAELAMVASVQIANSGRGVAGRSKSGRPNKIEDPAVRERAKAEWLSRRHKTRAAALAAVHLVTGDKTRNTSWCYANFGKPSGE